MTTKLDHQKYVGFFWLKEKGNPEEDTIIEIYIPEWSDGKGYVSWMGHDYNTKLDKLLNDIAKGKFFIERIDK